MNIVSVTDGLFKFFWEYTSIILIITIKNKAYHTKSCIRTELIHIACVTASFYGSSGFWDLTQFVVQMCSLPNIWKHSNILHIIISIDYLLQLRQTQIERGDMKNILHLNTDSFLYGIPDIEGIEDVIMERLAAKKVSKCCQLSLIW